MDGESLASELERGTRLEEATRVVFDWNLNERREGRRLSGRGVARVAPPYRARLDLFLADGETAAQATLVEGELAVPGGVPEGIIPPADLLWAALGVFRPGREASLVAARRVGEGVELRYGYGGGQELRYRIEGNRIREAALLQGGRPVHEVVLSQDGNGVYPTEATYRNVAEFRELKLTTRSIEHVDGYPEDIWFPGR